MTRQRVYGSDTEFCAWIRNCEKLPSISKEFGMSVSDNDITLHRYLTEVDSVGTREIQALMQLEIKTRRGKPAFSQMDTLSKLNMFAGQKQTDSGLVRFFGVFLLVMSGTHPDNSERMWWGSIPQGLVTGDATKLVWTRIGVDELIEILRFDKHPTSLTRRPFRRHHLTKEVVEVVKMPLGFEVEQKVISRS